MADKNLNIVVNAKNNTNNSFKEIEKNLGTIKSGFSGFNLSLLGLAGSFSYLGMQMIKSAGEFELTKASFTSLLGSVEKANTLLRDISTMGIKTPYNEADLQKGAQLLLAFNISASQVIPTLKMIGDVAMGNKDRMASMTLAFGQMSATGRLMGQDLNQMINAGFNPLQTISEKTGKSIGELKKEMEEGAISSQMVTQAFKDATSAGGRFYEMSEKQSQTFFGRMSTVQDIWDKFLRTQGQGLLVFASMALEKLAGILDWLIRDAEGFNWVGKTIYGLILFMKALGTTVSSIAKIMGTFIAMQIDGFINIGKTVFAFGKDFINVFKNIREVGISVFSAFAKALTGDFSGATETIKKSFSDTFTNSISNAEEFKTKTNFYLGEIGSEMMNIGESWSNFASLEGMSTTVQKFGELGTSIKDQVGSSLGNAGKEAEKLQSAFDKLKEKIVSTSTDSANAIEKIKEKIGTLKSELEQALVGNVKENLNLNKGLADEYVKQEELVAGLVEDVSKESDWRKKIELQKRLEFEQNELLKYSTIAMAYENEVAEARRVNSLSDIARAVEDLNKKRTIVNQEYQIKINKINKELLLEEQKQQKLIELQKFAIDNAKKFLAQQEIQTVESVNRQIKTYNDLAKAISLAQQGKLSSFSTIASGTEQRANQGIQSVNITIQGDVSGQDLIDKVKNGIMGDLALNNNL